MFAQFDLVISMRRNARALFALMVLSVFAPAAVLKAQDTRTVVEPTFPATCTALAAQQAIVSGEPASETTLDTTRIQTALTACPSGQAVELTLGGTNNVNNAFLTGPLNIPSGVTLVVDGGVTLFASRNPADYQSTATGAETCGTVGTAGNGCVPLIQINNGSASTGSGVMGYGVINGRGGDKLLKGGVTQTSSWWDLANQANGNGAQNNPILLYAKNAANFTIYKISLINAPFFHVKYQTASGFTVWGVKIVTPYTSRNTDGIDPTDKITNVTINNSYISDGDDNVALGASGTGNGVSNVSITNLHTYSGHGVSIGSYTSGGISNVYVNNVNMTGNLADTNSAGLKIKSAQDRGGLVNNVSYNNVCIQNIRYALQFNPTYNTNAGTSAPSYQNIGLHGVSIVGTANGQDQFNGYSANFPLGLTLDNLNITGNQPANVPAPRYTTFILGPGPVNPTSLQTLAGTGITYSGNITNPSLAAHACPTANFPFLVGELYLSTPTLTNKQTLSLPNPATFTLNAVVEPTEASSATPTSSIQFYEGTVQVGTAALSSNGTLASVTLSGVTSGAHTYTARYPADSSYAVLNFGPVTVNVNTTATTIAMTATPTSALYGQSVALAATVTPASGTTVPTGTVTFSSGSTVFGTATLNASGVATLNTSTLPVGNNAIVASYGGSSNFATSNSNATPVNVSISQAGSSTTVGAAPANTVYGGTVTLTSAVTAATSGTPTGTVTFMDGATILGTATLSASTTANTSVAQLQIATLNTGLHNITAVYGGDTNFTSSTSPTSAPETVFTASTSTTLGFTAGSVPYGGAVTMVATINASTATAATGTVTFTDLTTSTPLATVPITAGSSGASYTTSSLTVGTHSIQASYSGDTNYTGSNSSANPLIVTLAASTTTVSATSTSTTYGTPDTITVTVSPSTSGVPSGTVTFKDGSTVIGTQTLFGSTASITTSTLTGGSHSITVVYGGDTNFTGSTSTALVISVSVAPTTTAVSVPASITYGGSAALSATVTSSAAGTLTSTVMFKDGATTLGTGTVSGGAATFSAPGLIGGTHSITAVYSGDTNYGTSTSSASTLTVNKAATTAGVVAGTPTITFGGSETFTASVTPATATGTFKFMEGTATLGTGTIVSGTATFTTTGLTAGSHTITAVYSGDGNYLTSTTTTAAAVTVNQASSTTILGANPTSTPYLTSVVLTANVPSSATGSVAFFDGTTSLGVGTVASGIATFTATSLAGGTHSITAVYAGDSNYLGSTSSAVVVTITPATNGTTVAANPATISYGGSTVLTATLANTTGTGTVTFKDGASVLGSTAVSAGVATYNASSLTGGTHSITAVYSGDTNFAASTSAAISVVVNTAATTTTLTATPSTFAFGNSTALKATVSSTTASGTVTFKDGATTLGTAAVSAGVATFNAGSLLGGSHNITAIYSGDTNYATSTSAIATVVVTTAATTTSVVATPSTTTYGSSVTLTATVAPAGNTPGETGTVTFKDGATTIGTGTVSGGVASISISTLIAGAHSITASYSGDSNYATSASSSVSVTVNQVTPTLTVAANPSSITFGASTVLTATLTPLTATGTITFTDSIGGVLGAGTVSNGIATLTASSLVAGSHAITATYSGDVNDTAATSAATTVSVGLAATSTTVAAAPTTLTFGGSTTLSATVSPSAATGTVIFKDGATVLGTVSLSAGAASLPISTLGVGAHSITATYSGDSNNATSTSTAATVTVSQASSTTTISAPATGTYGTATLITVTVAPSAATGTVTFKDGSATLGTAAVSGGVATFSSILNAGNHSLSASYSGDANYSASSTTASASVVIAVATTSVVVAGNPSTVALGLPTTLSATITPSAATGTISFRDSGTGLLLGTAPLTGGTAALTGVVLSPAGAHTIIASYSGDVNDGASTSAPSLVTVAPGPSQITLSNTPASPVMYGSNLTLSTTNTTILGIAPTGTVQYLDGTTVLGTVPVTINSSSVPVSTFSLATLMPGTHTLTAVYSGDGNYGTSTSAAITFVVNQSNSTTTLVATPPQTVPGQTFTLTATAVSASGNGTPTGTITFFDQNNVSLGTVALVGGSASLQQTLTPLGTYTYTASYSGDVDFNPSSSASAPTTVAVKQLLSSTSVSASPTSGTFGAGTYTVTAIVTPASGGPATGTVTFMDGVNALGTVTLPSSNTVSLTNLTLNGGTHSITATYNGDSIYTSSVSPAPAVITVATAATTTSLAVNPATSTVGTSVTFSAAVTSTTSTVATGTVTFMNGSTLLGTGTLNASGIASFTSSTLPISVLNVTAVYSGDTNFSGSTSTSKVVTVTQIPQTITVSTIPASLTYGASPITVTATASSSLPVTLGVTGPASLNGSILTINGAGTVTVTATQGGNANYAAATPVVSTITVGKAALTVTIANQTIAYGTAIPTITGTITGVVNGDNITATYSTTATAASVPGTYPMTATLVDPNGRLGNYTVTNAGATLTISATAQTITFPAIPTAVTYGAAPVTLGATATSKLAVTYTVTGPATIAGSTLTYTGAGTVVVTAAQAGNSIYSAATSVTQTVVVAKAALTVAAANQSKAYGAAVPTLTGTLTGVVNGDNITATYATTGTATSAPGTYPITATLVDPNGRLANYTVTNTPGTLTVTTATETITFPSLPATVAYGASPITLGATASSGLAVVYQVTGPATITGSTLTITGAGAVVVTATQPGNTNYSAATSVAQTITVTPVALTVTAANATRAYGLANPTLSGTLTGVVNGDNITATYATTATPTSAPGTFPITATLVDPNNKLANYTVTNTAGTLTVTAGTTSVTLTLSAGTIFQNSAEIFTATVASPSGAPATGTVTFLNGATTLGTATVTGGVATLSLNNLAVGTYTVTASFAATTNYAGSVSGAASLSVVAPVVLTLSPSSLSLAAGASGTSTLTLAPSAGFTGAVTLACTSPVAYVTCTVTSPVTISGTTAGTATVTINVAATYGNLSIPQIGPDRGPSVVAFASLLPFGALILLPLIGRRRKLLANKGFRLMALVLMAAGMSLAVTGCAGGGSIAPKLPPAGAQTVTVTATANSATVTTTLTVNVTN